MDIREAFVLIEERWPFDSATYPELDGKPAAERWVFAVRHVLEHQAKSLGKLAELCEPKEHVSNPEFSASEMGSLQGLSVKFLMNALRLARTSGMDAEDVARHIRLWAAAGREER